MAPTRTVIDEWVLAARSGRAFRAAGAWGELDGVLAHRLETPRRRLFGGVAAPGPATIAFIAPQAPGLENAEEATHVEDAMAAGLLRSGVHVARTSELRLAAMPESDPSAWVEGIVQALHAAATLLPDARQALAGAWLSGSACALAVERQEDLAFLLLAAAPVPEVMNRRTSENEDDPAWTGSPTLRLADALSERSPLQAITRQTRPVLLLQGSCDEDLPMSHMEAWRAALAATGRTADGVEVAFADRFFRMVAPDGSVDRTGDEGHAVVASTVEEWTRRTLSATVARSIR